MAKHEFKSLSEKAMLVYVKVHQWQARVKDETVKYDVVKRNKADDDAGDWWTRLVPKEKIDPIFAAGRVVRRTFYEYTLPWLDGGLRILPNARFMKYSEAMKLAMEHWQDRVDYFVKEEFPDIFDHFEERLGKLAEGKSLPTPDEVRAKFEIETDMMNVPDVKDWRVKNINGLSEAQIKAIEKKAEDSIKALTTNAMSSLYAELKKLIDKIHVTLDDEDKTFHDTLIGNLRDFVTLIPDMNITDDTHLDTLRKECEKSLTNLNPDDLREDPEARKQAVIKAKSLSQKLKGYGF